jgi:hypothetical protein
MSTIDPRAAIAQLRAELQELVSSTAGYAPPPQPDGYEHRNPHKIGPAWHVPNSQAETGHTVRVIDSDEEPKAVFVEGGSFSFGGDMEAFTTQEARTFAMALLAAADWADGHNQIGPRRARTEAVRDMLAGRRGR